MKKLFYSIRVQAFLIVLAMTAILVIGHFVIIAPLLTEILLKQEIKGVYAAANTTANALDLEMRLAVKSLESLSRREEFRRMDLQRITQTLEVFDATNQYFIYTWAVNEEGQVIASPSRSDRVGEDRSYRDYFTVPTPANQTHFQKVQISTRGNFSLVISTIILNDVGYKAGVIAGSLGLMDRNPQIYQSVLEAPFPDEFKVFLVTGNNILLAHSDKQLPQPSEENLELLSKQPFMDYFDEEAHEARFVNYKGQRYILGFATVPSTDWRVVVQVPDFFVAENVKLVTKKLTFLLGVLLFSMLLIGLFFGERVAGSLSRLVSGLKIFGEKGEADPLPVQGGGEIKEAIDAFNKMVVERKSFEAALQESETLFRSLSEQAADAFFLHDMEGNLLDVNRRACESLGFSREELLSMTISNIDNLAVAEKYRKEIWSELQVGKPITLEGIHRRKDGTTFPVEVRIGLLVIQDKKYILALARDVTKNKENERLLRESEERFRTIFENSSDGILVADLESKKFVANNNRICEMIGYNCDELLALGVTDIHPQEDLPDILDKFEKQARKEISLVENIPVRRKDGTLFYADVNSAPFSLFGRPCMIGTFRDITGRKKAEEKLRKTEARQALILRSLPMAFYVAQPFGDFGGTWVSEQIDEISGFTSKQFTSDIHLWADRLHPDDRARTISAFESITAKETITVEYRWQHADGHYLWFQDNAALVRDEYGNPAEIIGTWLDISYRRKVEEDLRQAQKMESIGNLAGGIAHDFNNILMAIFGNIGLARMKVGQPDQTLDHLERINQSAIRAKELVEQILTFGRRTEQNKRPVGMDAVVKDALKLLRASIPTTIEIREEIAEQVSVLADQTQLHQIIMNLCTNAYQSMRESGGILKVALKKVEVTLDDFIMGYEVSPGSYAQLEISDTGCGIEKEIQKRIFEPYFTTKAYGDGVGLGLAVVHGIVKNHDGQIIVYSEKGKGTTFQVYLPVFATDAKTEEESPDPDTLQGGNEYLMFVDDEEENIVLVKEILTKHGYSVDIFTNGVQAWQEFQKYPDRYDLIITDMAMPSMTGAELAQKVIGIKPDIPIILCTGYSEMINREKSIAMGIRGYIQKPMTMSQLLGIVRQTLDNGGKNH